MTADAQRVAYHEAGHALVAIQVGRPVESVGLLRGGGATRGFPLAQDASPEEIVRALTVVLAGSAAEAHAPALAGPSIRAVPSADTDPWLSPAGELAAELAEDEDPAQARPSDDDLVAHWQDRIGPEAVERARALASELVEREAALGRLHLLALELLRRRHLSGAEVTATLEGGNGHAVDVSV